MGKTVICSLEQTIEGEPTYIDKYQAKLHNFLGNLGKYFYTDEEGIEDINKLLPTGVTIEKKIGMATVYSCNIVETMNFCREQEKKMEDMRKHLASIRFRI